MKTLLAGLLMCSVSACTALADTTLSFGADFKLTLPQDMVSGATFFASDELSVKTAKGQLLSGKVLSADTEQLPASFNMQRYPEYLLQLTPLTNLGSATAELFTNSSSEIDYRFGLSELEVKNNPNWTLYSLCKELQCLAYVVKHTNQEFILTLHTSGISKTDFNALVIGEFHAENE